MLARILAILLATSYLLLATPVFAQTSVPSGTGQASSPPASSLFPSPFPLPPYVSPTSPLYTDLLVNNLFHSFSCLAIGQSMIGQPCLSYQITKNAQGMLQGIPVLSQTNLSGGALGGVTSVIGALYTNQPVRTADYLASVGQNLGLVKEAHAQVGGSGAAVLNPILSLWQVSRNISYVIMIIIFLVIGLMVMFRNRINPQTVITAQTALPGLVIGLIMITFSYFFAGLITDTAFIGVNVVGYYFQTAQQSDPNPGPPKLVQDIERDNVGSIFSKYVGMLGSGDISGVIQSILDSLDDGVEFWIKALAGIIGFQTGASFGGPIGEIIAPIICGSTGGIGLIAAPFCAGLGKVMGSIAIGGLLGSIAYMRPADTFGMVIYFVAVAVLIYAMFKLLFKMITTYLSIIFLTITAPFQFLFASLPGRQNIATGWMLSMLANILAFPAVFAVFYFVAYLLGPEQNAGKFFNITAEHNLTTGNTLPLLGGLKLNFIKVLVAFGALVATPSIPDIISRALGRFSQAGQLIGQEIAGSTRSGQGYAGRFGAVPGQVMGGIFGPLRSAGSTYETVLDPRTGQPVTLYKPGLIGRIRGEVARIK